ncbi:hypothetical protein [Mastigocoleus testarum]|uniref:Uncharacterized protein n=1 Tax=Mastigocoleus testarum BC008 TaxID=371196 RepID=A0A0V7ZFA5_9CYAN|nr:hypothetical protein [Mastigocoleus testarum]KST63168.1 hypothetical protein BC008_12755 [Mastigocoleus testarum BC008]KST63187.1 hypothetical protein BC008_12840 [Mastigocoleus testarum BC008]
MAFPHRLKDIPEGIESTYDLIAEFDQCFLTGFANLESQHQETLKSWQYIFIGTPLEKPVNDACRAIEKNEFIEKHFLTLAATRAALQGSIFDGLQHQLLDVLERPQVMDADLKITSIDIPSHIQVCQESILQWLMEIALVGFSCLDRSTLVPFIPNLEKIQEEPLLIRQAALLTGYFNELIRQVPVKDSNSVCLYRWVDLWTQAAIAGLGTTVNSQPQTVSGSFTALGMDLKTHANLVSFTIYGLLQDENRTQLAKISQSAYKVDAISSDEIWLLFPDAEILLQAFANNKILYLNNIPMLPTGDLIWEDTAEFGCKYRLMEKAAEYFAPSSQISGCYTNPDTRHPIQIGEPVYLNNYQIVRQDGEIVIDLGEKGSLKIDRNRMSQFSPITDENILKSSEIFGLIRFDDRSWSLQPLAVMANQKTIYTGENAAKILRNKSRTTTVSILRERASKLLRKN